MRPGWLWQAYPKSRIWRSVPRWIQRFCYTPCPLSPYTTYRTLLWLLCLLSGSSPPWTTPWWILWVFYPTSTSPTPLLIFHSIIINLYSPTSLMIAGSELWTTARTSAGCVESEAYRCEAYSLTLLSLLYPELCLLLLSNKLSSAICSMSSSWSTWEILEGSAGAFGCRVLVVTLPPPQTFPKWDQCTPPKPDAS